RWMRWGIRLTAALPLLLLALTSGGRGPARPAAARPDTVHRPVAVAAWRFDPPDRAGNRDRDGDPDGHGDRDRRGDRDAAAHSPPALARPSGAPPPGAGAGVAPAASPAPPAGNPGLPDLPGAFVDQFADRDGTALTAHNPAWATDGGGWQVAGGAAGMGA